MARNKYKCKMKVENEIRSSLQLSGILTDEVKIEPSLEMREEVTAWQKSQSCFLFLVVTKPLCVYMRMHFVLLIHVL